MAEYTMRHKRLRVRGAWAGGLVLAVAAAVVPTGAASAQAAASVSAGSLKLTVPKVVAGAPADTLGWDYTAPAQPVPGRIKINVPAAFPAPQRSSSGSPGFVSTTSACAEFKVTGIAAQHDGSSTITVTVNCAAGLTGVISYADVAVPTLAGGYVFAATFAHRSSVIPFRQGDTVTVQPGPLASLVITPASATIAKGGTQTYAVQGRDAFGNSRGNVTGSTTFKITPNGRCGRSVCTASRLGPHTVTATDHGVSITASLTVAALDADLSVTETVSSSAPYYYQPTTFTTTVTNTSGVFWSDGVTASVNEPAGLVSPTATASGSTSYDASTSTWTIGSLAPGASATLTITGDAGAVSLGTQTVTATVTAKTPDPNPANNTASAAEASQPAPVAAVITPSPDNPPVIDISQPGDVTWYASAADAANSAAPAPAGVTTVWSCSAAGGEPCPAAPGLDQPDLPLTFTISDLSLDTYTITLLASANDPNYQTEPDQSSVTFTTTISDDGPAHPAHKSR